MSESGVCLCNFVYDNAIVMDDWSDLWFLRNVLLNSINNVDILGSFDYVKLFALVVEHKRWNYGQFELFFKFIR